MATPNDTGTANKRLYSAQPTFTVDGDTQPSLTDTALWLEVSDDIRGMTRLEGRFENWGTPPRGGEPGYMFFDGGVIGFGKKIEINLGAPNASRVVFSGRVTGIGATFSARAVPEISVLAEDALQFLRMTRRTRTYEDVTDADVARTLGAAHNLQVDADAPGPQHKVLVQLAQTDLAFLRDRAAAIDAQVWIEDGRLKFRARGARDGGDVSLTLGDALIRFSVVADLAHQVASVHAHGYDVAAKSDVDQDAESSLLTAEAKGGRLGSDIFQQAFGAREEHVLDRALSSDDEGTYFAEAALRQRGRAFVRCRGETQGTAALRVGSRVKINGVGPVFTGTYFATQVTHRYDRLRGYKTSFEAERPAIGQEG